MKINTNQQISEKETQGYIDYIENKYNRKPGYKYKRGFCRS